MRRARRLAARGPPGRFRRFRSLPRPLRFLSPPSRRLRPSRRLAQRLSLVGVVRLGRRVVQRGARHVEGPADRRLAGPGLERGGALRDLLPVPFEGQLF
jgi:hypothetical protein